MKEQKMGIDYFCIETDIKDDDKVFALRYLYATKAGGYDVGAGYAAASSTCWPTYTARASRRRCRCSVACACPSKWATRRRSWTRS